MSLQPAPLLKQPDGPGRWIHWPSKDSQFPLSYVTVEESPTIGRVCHELKQGGCAQCGYSDWNGAWRRLRN